MTAPRHHPILVRTAQLVSTLWTGCRNGQGLVLVSNRDDYRGDLVHRDKDWDMVAS